MTSDDLQTMAIFIAALAPLFSGLITLCLLPVYAVYRLVRGEIQYRRQRESADWTW